MFPSYTTWLSITRVDELTVTHEVDVEVGARTYEELHEDRTRYADGNAYIAC